MENIEIDPVREMQHLQAMYWHYKKLYRQTNLIMLFRGEKRCKAKKR